VVDALGLPLIFEITEGQRHDIQPAKGLLSKAGSRCLLADKAYDSDALRDALAAQGCASVIPSKASRAQRIPYDKELYKVRSEVECTFNLLKQALVALRRGTTRPFATTRPSSHSDARCSG
jgi:transposase